MRTISVGSVCLSSCSQLSPYYPSFFGSLSLPGEPGHCPENPWASPLLFPAPAPPCISPHLSRQSHLMGQPLEPLQDIPAASTLLHPTQSTQAGTLEGRKSLVTTQMTEDSVASVQDRPRQLGSPLSTGTEPGGAWLLPEAHTRLSVLGFISHLRTGSYRLGLLQLAMLGA